ncbi:hypothetical protein WA158_002410 [Blastocystis sp. Blastoise]
MFDDQANISSRKEGSLLCLGMPKGCEFGIDLNSWIVGDSFSGIKQIPQGVHIMFASSHGSFDDFGPRCLLFLNIESESIYISQWDKGNEEIVPENQLDNAVIFQYRESYKSHFFETSMAPYPLENHSKWNSFSCYISPSLLDRLVPVTGVIRNTIPERNEEGLPVAKKHYYTHLPQVSDYKNEFITQFVMDTSEAIQICIHNKYNDDIYSFLGEFQYSYICFFLGQDFDSFNQYKQFFFLFTHVDLLIHRNILMNSDSINEHSISSMDNKDIININENINSSAEVSIETQFPVSTYNNNIILSSSLYKTCILKGLECIYNQLLDMPTEFIFSTDDEKPTFIIECLQNLALIVKENENDICDEAISIWNKIFTFINKQGYDMYDHLDENDFAVVS